MDKPGKSLLVLLILMFIVSLTGISISAGVVFDFFLVCSLMLIAVAIRRHPSFGGFSYTILILAAVLPSLFYPEMFINWGSFELKGLIIPLLQIIMFGMGTAMSFYDFVGVVKMPKAVGIGVLCQFTIMPLIGFAIANLFDFPPEIAAGIILVGSSPSGLASNVMSYLAKANLALSITLTAVSTMLAPLVTPFLMKLLADQFVPIDPIDMVWSITKIVIIPIIGGLIFNHFLHGKVKWLDRAMPYISMAGIAFIITIITAAGRDSLLSIGLLLILAAILHNGLGYFIGYWSCRMLGMAEADCRTIALEVGMQNSGLASGLALEMGKLSTVGLAAAIFGPLMNISGSSLATWWRDRSIDES